MPGAAIEGDGDYELNSLRPLDLSDSARPSVTEQTNHLILRPRTRLGLWTVAASTSLVSTRRLLVYENYHYPFHLLTINLSVILIILVGNQFIPFLRDLIKAFRARQLRRPTAQWLISRLWPVLAALPTAASLPLLMQAILHFPNLPTLIMLSSIAFMSETVFVHLNLIPGILRAFNIRVLYMAFASWVILYDEYRLEPNGLALGIPAMLVSGLSTMQFQNARGLFGSSRSTRIPYSATNLLHISMPLALIITIAANVYTRLEYPSEAAYDLLHVKVLTLLVNVVSTVSAIFLGGSLVLPPVPFEESPAPSQGVYIPSQPRVIASLMQVGAVALASMIWTRRAYSTWVQLLAYAGFLLACLGQSRTMGARSRHRPAALSVPTRSPSAGGFPDDRSDRFLMHSRRTGSDVGLPPVSPMENGFANNAKHLSVSERRPYLRRSSSASPTIGSKQERPSSPVPRDVPSLSVIAIGALCWLLFALANFEYISFSKGYRPYKATLDRYYEPRSDFDIVINMYKEPVDEVRALIDEIKDLPEVGDMKGRVVVYVKDESVNQWQLQRDLGVETIHKLPNHGRESDAYLNHITYNWDDLARHTLFMQAGVHNRKEFFNRLRDYWTDSTGFLSLGYPGKLCEDCARCGDRFGWQDSLSVVSKTYGRVYNHKCGPVLLNYKGQFLVSGQRIHGTELRIYEEFRDALVNADSWAHSYEYVGDHADSMESPYLGYVLERMWGMMMQCSNLDIAWKCPSLLSGTRRGGDPSDCQCVDFIPEKILD